MIPNSHRYTIVRTQSIPLDVVMEAPDSISGFSSTRFTVGAIRDPELGLTTRSAALFLAPLHDTMDFGTNPEVKGLYLECTQDTTSVLREEDRYILQGANIYELTSPIRAKYDYNSNLDIKPRVDFSKKLNSNPIILDGESPLSVRFTKEYAAKYLKITQKDLDDIDVYKSHFPGILISPEISSRIGGRLNFFDLQLGFDSDYFSITGNCAELSITSTYNGVKKDTSFFFYLSPDKKYTTDNLFSKYATGTFPQSCLNITEQDADATVALTGADLDKMYMEGGGGMKPHISAVALRKAVMEKIASNGHDPSKAIINKASIILNFEAPDENFSKMFLLPEVLSPTVRLHKSDTTEKVTTTKVVYYGLTDASNENENQGNISQGTLCYRPDITYHLQELIDIEEGSEKWKDLQKGEFDLWLLAMAYESITKVNSSNSELSDYYSMLAYQNYYQSMYGGYGGYGYGDPYSNYYSYMMAANYANQSSTSTSTELQLDKDRFYKAVFYGPASSEINLRPRFEFSYCVPME